MLDTERRTYTASSKIWMEQLTCSLLCCHCETRNQWLVAWDKSNWQFQKWAQQHWLSAMEASFWEMMQRGSGFHGQQIHPYFEGNQETWRFQIHKILRSFRSWLFFSKFDAFLTKAPEPQTTQSHKPAQFKQTRLGSLLVNRSTGWVMYQGFVHLDAETRASGGANLFLRPAICLRFRCQWVWLRIHVTRKFAMPVSLKWS